MILHQLQKLLDENRDLVQTNAIMPDGKFVCHIIKAGQIVAKGFSVTLDRAIEKCLSDYAEYRKPDPRQHTLKM